MYQSSISILWSLEFGMSVFHNFLFIDFLGDELIQGQTLITDQVGWKEGNMKKNFDLSTGQLSKHHPRELRSESVKLVKLAMFFDQEFESSVFIMRK